MFRESIHTLVLSVGVAIVAIAAVVYAIAVILIAIIVAVFATIIASAIAASIAGGISLYYIHAFASVPLAIPSFIDIDHRYYIFYIPIISIIYCAIRSIADRKTFAAAIADTATTAFSAPIFAVLSRKNAYAAAAIAAFVFAGVIAGVCAFIVTISGFGYDYAINVGDAYGRNLLIFMFSFAPAVWVAIIAATAAFESDLIGVLPSPRKPLSKLPPR